MVPETRACAFSLRLHSQRIQPLVQTRLLVSSNKQKRVHVAQKQTVKLKTKRGAGQDTQSAEQFLQFQVNDAAAGRRWAGTDTGDI